MPASACDILDRLRVVEDATLGRLEWRRAWTRADGGLSIEYTDAEGGSVHARLDGGAEPAELRIEAATEDRKLPGLTSLLARPGAVLVTHRPGRRAVVRFESPTGLMYGRALRPKRMGRIGDALAWVGAQQSALFEDASPVERDDEAGLLICRGLPGDTMEGMAVACPVRYIDAAGRLGRGLASLDLVAPDWLPTHDAEAEAALLAAKAAELRGVLPDFAERAAAVLEPVRKQLLERPTPLGLVHRDLYDRQVLVDETGAVRLIDLDTLARGEPALDIGNLLAHFELRRLLEPHLHRVMRSAAQALLAGAALDNLAQGRARAYLDSARLRLAMLFALRPGQERAADGMLDLVGRPIEAPRPETGTTTNPSRDAQHQAPHFFVIGCPRSGTTLFERMLDAHSQIAMTHETHWITRYNRRRHGLGPKRRVTPALLDALYADKRFVRVAPARSEVERWLDAGQLRYEELVARVFGRFGDAMGGEVVGDKSTGGYIHNLAALHGVCPRARVVHLIRDGRDVCLSMLDWPKAGRAAGRFPMWRTDPVATTAAWWRWQVLAACDAGRALGDSVYREVRYEDLVAQPVETSRAVSEFLGLAFEPRMVEFTSGRSSPSEGRSANRAWLPPTRGIRDWRRDLPAEDAAVFEAIAGDALQKLGYERRHESPSEAVLVRAQAAVRMWQEQSGEMAARPNGRPEIITRTNSVSVGEEL